MKEIDKILEDCNIKVEQINFRGSYLNIPSALICNGKMIGEIGINLSGQTYYVIDGIIHMESELLKDSELMRHLRLNYKLKVFL